VRHRYRWDESKQKLVEVNADWTPSPRVELRTGSCYDDARAQDGTDISSRRKRNEYMAARNYADADDFKGEWAKAAKEREARAAGAPDRARRDAIGRTIYELEKKGRGR
jgi:hypothetical protein